MKSISKEYPLIFERWDKEHFVVRYHIEEVPDEEGVKYEYEEVIVKEVSKKGIIDALVARKYDFNDEIALAFKREGDEEDIAEHEAYIAECKAIAEEVLANR